MPRHIRRIDSALNIHEEADCLQLRRGSRTAAWMALLPVAIAVFFLWQTLAFGGVRAPRSYMVGGPVAGCVLTAVFLALAVAWVVVTGWMEWIRLDRSTRTVTRRIGVLFPWWKRERPLADFFRVRVVDIWGGRKDATPQFDVWLEGREERMPLATFASRAEAEALAGQVARFLGLAKEDHAARRAAANAAAAAAERPPAEFSVSRNGTRVTLRVGGRQAEWDTAVVTRGVLYVLTPAKGGGEIALMAVARDGARTDLLAWSRYDEEIRATLCEHEAELRALFRDGFETQGGADA